MNGIWIIELNLRRKWEIEREKNWNNIEGLQFFFQLPLNPCEWHKRCRQRNKNENILFAAVQ